MPYLDFQHIKEAVKIETAAHALQLTMSKSGAQMRGACPACKAGGDRALAVNTDKQSFYCFASRAGGDVIGLTAHVQGIAQKDAALWLHNRFLEQVPASAGAVSTAPLKGTVPHSAPSPTGQQGMCALDYLEVDHPAVEAVGFDAATASALGIGFASKGMMRGLVAVPVRLPDGTLAGYLGITEARLPNRWHLGENVVPMKKSA